MRSYLGGSRSVRSLRSKMVFDLFTARARGFEIFLGVALDLRLAILTRLDLIAQPAQSRSQLRTVDRSRVMLRGIQLMRLNGPRLSVVPLGDVEDDGVGMELRCSVTFEGACGILLEGGSHKLARCLGSMDVPNSCLGVLL